MVLAGALNERRLRRLWRLVTIVAPVAFMLERQPRDLGENLATPPQSHATPAKRKRSLWTIISEQLAEWRVRPLTDYYLILGIVGLLTIVGVIMVMSSSMTWSVIDNANVFSTATKQTFMVLAGIVAMIATMHLNPRRLRRLAPWALVITFALLLLVLIPGIGTGREEWGSQSWIVFGPIRLQPSEIARVVIALWGAHYLADADPHEDYRTNKLLRFGLVAAAITALIYLEGDTGMSISFLLVVAVLLIFAGMDFRGIALLAAFGVLGIVALLFGGGYRSDRFTVYFDALVGHFADTKGIAFQSYQGFLSLSDGSLFGVGLGQSRAKWFYLPEAKNDFIFAIIGEELGLIGAGLVIFLFGLLGFIGLRTAQRTANQFLALLAATLTMALVIQAFINIGYVIGMLPVTGIQLPLISAGGTSAIITLGAMGMLVTCARYEPQAISAMASYGRPAIDKWLFLKEPSLEDCENPAAGSQPRSQETRPQSKAQAPRPSAQASRPVLRESADRQRTGGTSSASRRRQRDANLPEQPPRRDSYSAGYRGSSATNPGDGFSAPARTRRPSVGREEERR